MAVLMPEGRQSFEDSAGRPLVGGKLYTYAAGTSAPQGTWIDAGQTTPNTNPIILDARGEATIFWSGSYKVVLTDALDAVIWTQDNVVSTDVETGNVSGQLTAFIGDLANNSDVSKGDALIGVRRTAANAVPTTVHSWIEGTVLDAARDFGVVADGVTDQQAKMAVAIATCTALAPCTLELPRGVIYCATALGNLAVNGLTIRGKGILETTLKFGHAGIAMLADAFASGSPLDPFVKTDLLDFTIQGNTNTTYLLQAQGLARANIRLNGKDANPASGIAFHLKGVMLSQIQLWCSTDINAMSFIPNEGLRVEAGTRASINVGNSSNNTFIELRFVGLVIGERFSGADQNLILGGAAESNSAYGLIVSAGCRYNTFINHGLENPASTADFGDAGESTRFLNGYSVKSVQLQGRGCKIDGGFFERIEVQGGAVANIVEGVRLNNWRTGSGGFFDSGTATEWKNLRGTALTCTFATSVMTVTAVAQGRINVGDEVFAAGVAAGTTIASLGTGTGGTGTYNLSTSPGTLSSRSVSTGGYVFPYASRQNLVGLIPVAPATFTWRNTTGQYVEIYLSNGTVSAVSITRDADIAVARSTAIPNVYLLAPNDTFSVTYSVAPSLFGYIPHNGFQG